MSETKTIWHPYPQEKPDKEDRYMVTTDVFFGYATEVLTLRYLKDDKFILHDDRVIAWAELPEPYKGVTDEQEIQKDKE